MFHSKAQIAHVFPLHQSECFCSGSQLCISTTCRRAGRFQTRHLPQHLQGMLSPWPIYNKMINFTPVVFIRPTPYYSYSHSGNTSSMDTKPALRHPGETSSSPHSENQRKDLQPIILKSLCALFFNPLS